MSIHTDWSDYNKYYIGNNATLGTAQPDPNFWDNYLTGFGNYLTKNPLQPLNLGYGIWSSINDYRMQKQNYNLARDAYNFQKQMAENNEARNQERFNWLRDARATSQL